MAKVNLLQEQLLKAGLVKKSKVAEVAREQNRARYAKGPSEPGDIQLLNNHVTYHSRTAIVDFEEPDRKRLVYRLWLSTPQNRELPASHDVLWGPTAAGAVRGGVTPPSGLRNVDDWRKAAGRSA